MWALSVLRWQRMRHDFCRFITQFHKVAFLQFNEAWVKVDDELWKARRIEQIDAEFFFSNYTNNICEDHKQWFCLSWDGTVAACAESVFFKSTRVRSDFLHCCQLLCGKWSGWTDSDRSYLLPPTGRHLGVPSHCLPAVVNARGRFTELNRDWRVANVFSLGKSLADSLSSALCVAEWMNAFWSLLEPPALLREKIAQRLDKSARDYCFLSVAFAIVVKVALSEKWVSVRYWLACKKSVFRFLTPHDLLRF